MRLQIVSNRVRRMMACAVLSACAASAFAGIVETNPLCIAAIAEGYAVIQKGEKGQTRNQAEMAVLQNAIGAEYTMMKNWESKYNSYLKTAQGYGTSLKASMAIYSEGVRTLRYLWEIRKAIGRNPEGAFATFSMNNLYLATASEFLKVYNLLNKTIAQGGTKNMLNGAERTQMLWTANDELAYLNRKLRSLIISISYYNLTDVWNNATAGLTRRGLGEVAGQALDRWRRAAKVSMEIRR